MTTYCYTFDRFKLFPGERRLVDATQAEDIRIQNKCLNLLIALVERSGHLLTREELINRTWGSDTHIEPGNLNTQISTLRRLLGDNEASPRLIETVHGTGFRFKARVLREEVDLEALLPPPSKKIAEHAPFEVESHRFVPTYIGIPTNTGVERSTKWGMYREVLFKDARLCIMSNGVGVWHIRDALQFPALTDLALWRQDAFRSILSGTHAINAFTARLVSKERTRTFGVLDRFAGKFEYVLSMFAIKQHGWRNNQLKAALELASCPRVLLQREGSSFDNSDARLRELELLESGYEHPDSRRFGVFGMDFGCANWGGVSYHGFQRDSSTFLESIIGFELALQSLWLFSYLIRKAAENCDVEDEEALHEAASMMRADFGRIQAIGPTDSTPVRTMCEAIVATSRIRSHVTATLEALSKPGRKTP